MRIRRNRVTRGVALCLGCVAAGCVTNLRWPQPGWHYDYESAQARAGREGATLLVYYSESRPGTHDPLRDALRNPELSRGCTRFVRCRLYVSHEPDRRFVGQYGVSRAPAWIIIHPDGTYHSRTGAVSVEEVLSFIQEAQPPGQPPQGYAFLPARSGAGWPTDLPAAEAEAEREGCPLVVLYTRLLSRDWSKLEPLLDTTEVRRALSGHARCRVDIAGPWTEEAETPFGRLRLPAMIVRRVDGTSEVIERPNSARAIVQLVRREANAAAESPVEEGSSGTAHSATQTAGSH